MADEPLLSIKGLTKHFPSTTFGRGPVVRAVEDVSFDVPKGQVVGLVGESGSGKTTVGRMIARLIQPTSGSIRFAGNEAAHLSGRNRRRFHARLQYIFQDPFASLSPRMTIGEILTEGLYIQRIGTKAERQQRALAALAAVDLPADAYGRYAHEFSGGQRQRIGIARALVLEPEVIVADEPVSALDVSIQAQIINLLRDLQKRLGLTMLFIAHDLAVVEYVADTVIVLYLGKIMEIASTRDLYANPQHPYTRALLSAVPSPDPERRGHRQILKGEVPSPANPPSGCVFRTRCSFAIEACGQAIPALRELTPGHRTACIRDDVVLRQGEFATILPGG
jgi:peptide/nickel transport system ATP-binding protein